MKKITIEAEHGFGSLMGEVGESIIVTLGNGKKMKVTIWDDTLVVSSLAVASEKLNSVVLAGCVDVIFD